VAPADAEDDVVAVLWEHGTAGVHVQPGPAGAAVLLAYFPDRPALLADLRAALSPLGLAGIEPTDIPDVDWVARFREGFHAFAAAGFSIIPSWDPAPVPSEATRTLRVLPARAFGTGTHETTRLCLGALRALAGRRRLGRLADLGAGTGILAVAAARLGAGPVIALDIDPEAVASSRLHARMNEVGVHVVQGDGAGPLRAGIFDVVVANLTAPLLIERREEIAALRAPSGALVLSGFLRDDADAIADAYAARGSDSIRVDGEWAALVVETQP